MIGYGKWVLVVDNHEPMRRLLTAVLEQEGYTVVQASDGVQALHEIQAHHCDAVVTDYEIPHLNGLDILRQSRTVWPEIPVIFFSELDWEQADMAEALGAFAWIRKSSDFNVLLSILALAVATDSAQPMERISASA